MFHGKADETVLMSRGQLSPGVGEGLLLIACLCGH
jgi:hypothetical protein